MTGSTLGEVYRDYIACLNARDWANLGRFVDDEVRHNGEPIDLSGYRAMLERDVDAIPDLRFDIELLVVDPPHVASRLRFDCTPKGRFLGLDVNGRRVVFCENVFYRFEGAASTRFGRLSTKRPSKRNSERRQLPEKDLALLWATIIARQA